MIIGYMLDSGDTYGRGTQFLHRGGDSVTQRRYTYTNNDKKRVILIRSCTPDTVSP